METVDRLWDSAEMRVGRTFVFVGGFLVDFVSLGNGMESDFPIPQLLVRVKLQ